MGEYTDFFSAEAETLSPIDDCFEEKLVEIASSFRDFGAALTSFMIDHGYNGDSNDVIEKAKFLQKCYKQSNVEDCPRDFKKWFSPGFKIKRETVFPLLFALDLNLEESADFFRRVQFERSFDCHTGSEAIYYFCIKNKLSYSEAKKAINQIPKERVRTVPKQETLYTTTIVEYLDAVDNLSKVVTYISDNQSDFEYNNATAIKFIQDRWFKISCANGIAEQEGKLINKNSMTDNSSEKKRSTSNYKEIIYNEDNLVTAGESASTWTIYSQILGLDYYTEHKYSSTRSLSPVFTNNVLLPLRSSECFPSRQSIEGVLRGKNADHEVFRKLLILLVFYVFWAKKEIEHDNIYFTAKRDDGERCESLINAYLFDAGYPKLYPGNPYDWIFMWALKDDTPLDCFRSYIREVFAVDSENQHE